MAKEYTEFLKTKLCQGDETLFRYYQNNDTKRFRARLNRLYNTTEVCKNINSVVISMISASCRDIIYNVVGLISKEFKSMGDMIITGGDAFNLYMKPEDRITTIDIDTKFVPVFKSADGKLITPNQKEYFGYLQVFKLLLWNYMGVLAENYLNTVIPHRVNLLVKNSKVGKLLGVSLPASGPWVTRRYHLIRKKKQSTNSTVTAMDVLIDVELFAFDLTIRYFSPVTNKIQVHNLGGILDIAIMRPGEVGYEVLHCQQKGITYTNPISGKIITNNNVYVAGKKFLLEDLYIMQSLGLRPWKKKTDLRKMYVFAKKVLKADVKSTDPFRTILLKTLPKLHNKPVSINKRPIFAKKHIQKASTVNPYKYEAYTTAPDIERIQRKFLAGSNTAKPGFTATDGNYKFYPNKSEWSKSKNPYYIKDQYKFRADTTTPITIPTDIKSWQMLYGYNPTRNSWVSRSIIDKAAVMPLVGLKNTKV